MNDNYFIPLFDKDIIFNKDEYNDALLYISKNNIVDRMFNTTNKSPIDPNEMLSFDDFEEQLQDINISDELDDQDEIENFKDELLDECEKNHHLYQSAIPIYANYIRTEKFCDALFSYILDLTFAPYPDIKYHIASIDMKIIKNMILKDIASGKKKPVNNIFSKKWYSEYQYLNMLLYDNTIKEENVMNPIMNCKCEWLYMSFNVKKHIRFIKKMVSNNLLTISKEELSNVLKNAKEITMCYRLLPSPNTTNLFSLIHNLQLYL